MCYFIPFHTCTILPALSGFDPEELCVNTNVAPGFTSSLVPNIDEPCVNTTGEPLDQPAQQQVGVLMTGVCAEEHKYPRVRKKWFLHHGENKISFERRDEETWELPLVWAAKTHPEDGQGFGHVRPYESIWEHSLFAPPTLHLTSEQVWHEARPSGCCKYEQESGVLVWFTGDPLECMCERGSWILISSDLVLTVTTFLELLASVYISVVPGSIALNDFKDFRIIILVFTSDPPVIDRTQLFKTYRQCLCFLTWIHNLQNLERVKAANQFL